MSKFFIFICLTPLGLFFNACAYFSAVLLFRSYWLADLYANSSEVLLDAALRPFVILFLEDLIMFPLLTIGVLYALLILMSLHDSDEAQNENAMEEMVSE